MRKIAKLAIASALRSLMLAASAGSARASGPASKRKSRDDQTSGRPGGYLVRAVRHQLLMLPYYSVFDNIEFSVDGYRVTLSGEVVRPTLKSDAENVVKRIEGVERVVNKIKVLPASFNDDRIRHATYRAIYRHPVLNRYALQSVHPILIIVVNSYFTLVDVAAN